jgi:hypothetical protein
MLPAEAAAVGNSAASRISPRLSIEAVTLKGTRGSGTVPLPGSQGMERWFGLLVTANNLPVLGRAGPRRT